MDELLRLRGERGHDTARTVAHREHPDPAREVDEGVAVDVVDERPLRALDDHLGRLAQAPGHGAGPAGENLPALGARDLGLESDRSHAQPPRAQLVIVTRSARREKRRGR